MSKLSQNYFDLYNANDDLKLFSIFTSSLNAKCIYLGVKSGLFTQIENGVNDLKLLAKNLEYNQERLYRLLKNLEHINIVKETKENKFSLTTYGEKLLPNRKGSMAHLATFWGEELHESTNDLQKLMKSDKSGFELKYNENIYSYLNKNKKAAEGFDLAMRGISECFNKEIPNEMDFSNIKTIADVGGGSGANLREIISKHTHLNGILFDQKNVIERAMSEMEPFQHKNRVELIAGDFFKPLPFKADCIMMSNIIHNWDDEKAIQILTNCRKALTENGKLYLVEMALEHSIEPLLARSMDLTMMVMTSGKERTFKEFEKIFEASGLKLSTAKNILNMTCLIEAKAIN